MLEDPLGQAGVSTRASSPGSSTQRIPRFNACTPLAVTNDKVFTFWAVEKFPDAGRIPKERLNLPAFDALAGQSLAKLIDAERRATAAAMIEAGRPNCTFTLQKVDEEHLGAF